MKKEINAGIMVAAAVAVVVTIGVVAWRMFGPEPPPPDTPEVRAEAKRWVESFKGQQTPPQK